MAGLAGALAGAFIIMKAKQYYDMKFTELGKKCKGIHDHNKFQLCKNENKLILLKEIKIKLINSKKLCKKAKNNTDKCEEKIKEQLSRIDKEIEKTNKAIKSWSSVVND